MPHQPVLAVFEPPKDLKLPAILQSVPNSLTRQQVNKRLQEEEFGTLTNKDYTYKSRWHYQDKFEQHRNEPSLAYFIMVYMNYLVLVIFGHCEDWLGKRFKPKVYGHLTNEDGFAPLYNEFDSFYIRNFKRRVDDCFSLPISGVPGRVTHVLNRVSNDYNQTYELTGTSTPCLNLSSYNYLGFAQSKGKCTQHAIKALDEYGPSQCATRMDGGTTKLHQETEKLVAEFVQREAAMVFSMGYGTNAWLFSCLLDKGCLIVSDELNHTSIRTGCRLSGAVITTFKHNNVKDLEKVLRHHISQGQSKTHRPWKKILVAIEGLYSMEGTICDLPGIIKLKDKYKFYLFMDEAHSIGAMGPNGRGVCDYFNISPKHVDIMMGTFTKSFGAAGGYVSGSKELIDRMKLYNLGFVKAESVSAAVLGQIYTSIQIILGNVNPGEGQERIARLAFNSRYLRLGLKRLGFIISGNDDSPVIPLFVYHPSKMQGFSKMMFARRIAVVLVGYPATSLVESRVRFCMSAALTKQDLDYILEMCDQVGEDLYLKLGPGARSNNGKGPFKHWSIEDVLAHGVEGARTEGRLPE